MIIVLNPEEALRLEYEHKWSDITTFEGFLSIIAQRESILAAIAGYERVGGVQ